jgi:hypothetical protein
MPSAELFFCEVAETLRPGGLLLLAEPAGHVKPEQFLKQLHAAEAAGLTEVSRPAVRRSHAALLKRI